MLCNLSGPVTQLTHKEPSILDPLKLIDPISIQMEEGGPPLSLTSLDTHSTTGINID